MIPDTAIVNQDTGEITVDNVTYYGYIGLADNIEYATEDEALEANPNN